MTPDRDTHSALADPRLALTRRKLLKVGGVGVLGWSLPELMSIEASAAADSGRVAAKNVLVVLEQGGLSHIDTWDPKPDAAVDHRSPHSPIDTSVPGIQFTELLSETAKVAHHLAVVRSMYHPRGGANGHPTGTQYTLSGQHPSGPTEMPDIGSVVALLQGTSCSYLPPYVMVPGNHEQAKESRTGFLPASLKVFKTGGRDVSDPNWKVGELLPREENLNERLGARRDLLKSLDQAFLRGPSLGSEAVKRDSQGMDRFYEQAFETLTSDKVSAAFSLETESAATREKYGQGHRGACYLVGRKLIEAGVRFVTVDVRWPRTEKLPGGTNLNWDHHDFIYSKHTCNLPGASGAGRGRRGIGTWEMMGSTDQAFTALIEDLHQRGLLEETLVCFVTEFGRTPKINKFQGRDHWTHAYSIALAGAGVPGGQVIGSSDRDGGFVATEPHTPEDYGSTIYEKLGINRARPIFTPGGRPVFFGHAGKPILELF